MAKRPLKDADALTICRTPKPTPTKMRRVLGWASDAPSGDKILPLLTLQTHNWASRKDLHADFHAALVACAAVDPDPLWRTVEHDHDTYRVWHAIQCLTALDDESLLNRLISLGDTPLMGIHWSVIDQAASECGLPMPKQISNARTLLEARQNVVDFYDVYSARKPEWPAELDPDPRLAKRKRVVLKATVDAAAESRADDLRAALGVREATLSEQRR